MIKKLLVFAFLSFSLVVNASFSLSGSTITQTGTDTDLSGLSSISGVTILQQGVGTDSEYIVYDIGNYNLIINGTLTIDASKEQLLIGSSAPTNIVTVNGTLSINDFETINSFTSYRQRTAIRSTYTNNDCCGNFSLNVTNGATFNMLGGAIEASSSIQFQANSTINIESGRIELLPSSNPQYQIRQFSTSFTANNFFMVKYVLVIIGRPLQLDNYTPTQADEGILFSSSSDDFVHEFRNYSGGSRGNRLDLGLWSSKKGKIINSASGTDLIIGEHLTSNTSSTGTWQITKEISPTIIDITGNPIQNAKLFIRDTDNGNRIDGNGFNFTDDRTYFASSNASGVIATTEILTGAVNHLSASGTITFDRRSKNNDTNDEFDILFYHYNKVLSRGTQKLKGVDELSFEYILFDDTNITEEDPTVVASYATIDNLGQLYDYAKYWKQLNETNIEVPSTNKLLIEINSSLLDLDDYNLTIDATATSVFSVDTSTKTITIKSSTLLTSSKFIGITTTGTITTSNGASLEHGYIDASGTHKFVNLKWNQATTNDVSIINRDDSSAILGPTVATETYKNHFLVPNPVPTDGIEVQIDILSNGPNLFQEIIPTDDLNFVRLDIDLIDIGTELNQLKILKLSERLLAKLEAINSSMINATTPTVVINETITAASGDGTLENQEAILTLLKRILSKVTAAREALKTD